MSTALEAADSKYAPLGKRVGAFCIDLIVLGFGTLLAQFTVPYFAPILLWVAYKTLFECSAVQATPGKRALDLIVVGPDGRRMTFLNSLWRTLIAFLAIFTGFALYLVAFFTPRKQTLHDLAADTFVVEGHKRAESGHAWLEEVKSVYEWIRARFQHGEGYYTERQRLELIALLNKLKNDGAITETEFKSRKRAILGGEEE